MDYAALRDKACPNASFFIKSDEVQLPNEYYEVRDSLAYKKLNCLRQKIIHQKDYPVHIYTSAKELGNILLQELISMIKREFPEEGSDLKTSILQRHEAALERHSFTLFQLPNIEQNMEQWKRNGYGLLLITGASGSGTSNNLAVTTKYMREKNPSHRILYYDFESADPTKDLMDDFFAFMQLGENKIPEDEWSMIAIDNASLLDFEQTEMLLD